MDNETVSIGNTTYDLVYEEGVVIEASPNAYTVKFKNGVVAKYVGDGYSLTMKRRTLYWHSPVFFAPPKSASKSNFIHKTLSDLAQSLKGKL